MGGGVVAATLLILTSSAGFTGVLAAGPEKAKACAVCHGKDGIAIRPDAPNIAGQNSTYLRGQLMAYRTGERVHAEMNIIAKELSDQDVDDLVMWYSTIKFNVELPE